MTKWTTNTVSPSLVGVPPPVGHRVFEAHEEGRPKRSLVPAISVVYRRIHDPLLVVRRLSLSRRLAASDCQV